MPEGTNEKNNQEKEKSSLNKREGDSIPVNRGVELLLRNRRRKPEPPKTFQIKFGNMVSFMKREIVSQSRSDARRNMTEMIAENVRVTANIVLPPWVTSFS